MSHNLDSPVQTQMAVSVINHSNEYHHGSRKSDPNSICKRRVFVQTDMGCVLGIELDRRDNAHTVKRKLQLALNFPIEDSSLTCGDRVLENENDLNAVKTDSPLLLSRKLIHRSASTPCLSPTAKDLQQRDKSSLVEVLGCGPDTRTKHLVQDVIKGIKSGVNPIPVNGGLGGAYNFRNSKGESVAIVKPTDEEPFAPNNPKGFVGKALGQPGLKRSVRVGETGYREVAAYLLDYDNFANVPPTVLVKVTHSIFNVNGTVHERNSQHPQPVSKIASFQQFIPHDFDASDHGTSSFSVSAVHRIGILDIRIFNTDRHAGNLLVKKVVDSGGNGRFGRAKMELIPIDHGLCLPENLEDPYFEWIHWPQASIPFSEDELKYIAKLDPVKDSEMLKSKLPMIREACLRVLVLSTVFLKEAAAFGLCLAEIGEMMSREFTGGEEEPSELELVCIEARKLVAEKEAFVLSPHSVFGDEDETQFLLDSEDMSSPYRNHYRNPFSRLGSLEEEDEDDDGENENALSNARVGKNLVSCVSNISMSLRDVSLSKKTRSANEQLLPASASFVKVADMGDEEWRAFLEKFQELLHEAFRDRKCGAGKQKQRLGTSCQF